MDKTGDGGFGSLRKQRCEDPIQNCGRPLRNQEYKDFTSTSVDRAGRFLKLKD